MRLSATILKIKDMFTINGIAFRADTKSCRLVYYIHLSDVSLHFRDRRDAALLRYRITVLIALLIFVPEQKLSGAV